MEFASGNIYLRAEADLAAGTVIDGHWHNFDHTTFVSKGAFKVERWDGKEMVGEPVNTVIKRAGERYNWVLIKANYCHRLTALEDGSTYHCIYSHRTPQGEIVQDFDGWMAAFY